MRIGLYFLILLINFILGQDEYEELISETVTEQYCNEVISNLTALLNEGYIYTDFIKAPIQPKGNESYYINKVDLINELEKIPKINRKYYDFIRDIYTIIRKTKDGHLLFIAQQSPSNNDLSRYCFLLPFVFNVVNNVDENGNINGTDLRIRMDLLSLENPDHENFVKYINKKIISINGIDPFQFIEEFAKNIKYPYCHSLQCNYIQALDDITSLSLSQYPLIKEELPNITIIFKGEEKEVKVNYMFYALKKKSKLHQFYLEKIKSNIKNNIPLPIFKEVVKEFQLKNELNYRKLQDDWDYIDKDESIKCKIDKKNEVNVLLQKTFGPRNYDDYENTMFKCLSEFYSNEYNIIIIEDRNGGGYSELCVPFTQYIRPKVLKTLSSSQKATELNYEYFIKGDENLNYDTCTPYSNKNELYRNKADIYKDGAKEVIHNRTKEYELYSIYSKKLMEEKRREYLATNKTKKPTEIIVFTDGFSFSCTSVFIKGLQVYGSAIIVGYNSIPNISKIDFDASQSNSAVERFVDSEYIENLSNLGFEVRITNMEQFDPNDKSEPKIPMEFRIYPVDIISNISSRYEDFYYERFIKEAKSIFDRYNAKNECNPDNELLYYETSECDSKINIEHGHGGYLCGKDGYWNKNNCTVAYCDVGYILNNEKNKCIEDPCEKIILNNITLNCEKEIEYEIEPNKAYIFTLDENNGKCSYTFYSELDNFFFTYNNQKVLKPVKNGTEFTGNNKIYTNFYLNTTENIKINIKAENEDEDEDEKEYNHNSLLNRKRKKNKLSTAGIILISIFGSLAAIGITLLVCILSQRANTTSKALTYPIDNEGTKNNIRYNMT